MSNPTDYAEVDRLTSALLDKVISDTDFNELDRILSQSPHLRKRYLEIVSMESIFHWDRSSSFKYEELKPKTAKDEKIVRFPVFPAIGTLAATLIAMAGSLWVFKNLASLVHSGGDAANSMSENIYEYQSSFVSQNKIENDEGSLSRKSHSINESWQFAESKALEQVARGVESLERASDGTYEALLEYYGKLGSWKRESFLSRPAERGILPFSGNTMIALGPMVVDIEAKSAQTIETIQVLDVREAIKQSNGKRALVSASVKFNQSFGESYEGTEFGITLTAYRDDLEESLTAVASKQGCLQTDLDPGTWEALSTEIELPEQTGFVVVSLSAAKKGADAILANSCNYYSDDLKVFFQLEDQSVIGPI